jgi:hypothetical protein
MSASATSETQHSYHQSAIVAPPRSSGSDCTRHSTAVSTFTLFRFKTDEEHVKLVQSR